ncbi:MAG TPA: molybdopterin-dependent oxidoreductase [Nocardioidaceae bacterium]|nr:molybdopterin-dependent oxidoreductase [Nocardioidaceae bacterium]
MSTDQPQAPRWPAALAGIVTGLTGLAVALAVTSLLRQRANPVQSVSEMVRDITPGPLAEKLIHLVGTADKPLLLTGVTLGLLGLSAWAGILARRQLLAGAAVFLVMSVIAGVAVMTRHGATSAGLLPVVMGAAAWVVTLTYLRPLQSRSESLPYDVVGATDRRGFLIRVGGVAAAAAVVGVSSRFLSRSRRAVEAARSQLRLPVTRGTVPAGAGLDVKGLYPWQTPNDVFYRIDTALVVPTIKPSEWELRIHGMVDREITIQYDDLVARELTEAWVTLCCVSNPIGGHLIGNAWWSGVRIADLLAEAGVHADADAVLQTSQDGWTCGTPIKALTDDRNALLALAMNGKALPLEHGFPVRMVVPGLYGFVSATKWVVDLEVSRFDKFDAYWTTRSWSEQAPIKTQSRIDVPRGGRAMAGDVTVAGVAWAQHTGIEKVEVRLDGGPWEQVELARVPGVDTWVQWSGTVEASPGIHTLAVRATDLTGTTQTPVETAVAPDGASGWHAIEFTADG